MTTTNNSSGRISAPIPLQAFWVSLVVTIINAVITIILLVIGSQVGIWQIMALGGITLTFAIAGGISVVLSRRGQMQIGIWMIIGALIVTVPLVSLMFQGVGWILLMILPLVIILITEKSLPAKQTSWAITIGILSGIAALLIDLFSSLNRYPLPSSDLQNIIWSGLFALLSVYVIGRSFNSYTMRTKLLIFMLLVAIIPMSLLAYQNDRTSRRTLTDAASTALSLTAASTASQIDNFISGNLSSIETEAKLPEFVFILNTEPQFRTTSMIYEAEAALTILRGRDLENIQSYALIDREGNFIASSPYTIDRSSLYLGLDEGMISGLKMMLLTGLPYLSPVKFVENSETPSLYFASRVESGNGQPIGLLIARYDATILQDILVTNNGKAGPDSFGVLFDENNIHLAHGTAPERLFKSVAPLSRDTLEEMIAANRLPDVPGGDLTTSLPDLDQKLLNSNRQPIFSATDIATGDRIDQVAVQQLESSLWKVAFFQPQDIFLGQVEEQTRNIVLLGLIIAVIVATSTLGVSQLLTAPISNLTELVERISKGDLRIQIPIITQDEIGRLAMTFNTMTNQMRNMLSGLEKQVTDRTSDLEHQATQLQMAAEVARDASAIQELDELLKRAVSLISERFGFYHTGIFLVDDRNEFAVLRAANSPGGQVMLENNHKLRIGEVGIVGYVADIGEARSALNVGLDSVHFKNPHLPKTRSEISLPLKIGVKVIGVLDVQSTDEIEFDKDDIAVLQIMADQLAIAIQNARLFLETQNALQEAEITSGRFTQEMWREFIQNRKETLGYRYRRLDIEPSIEYPQESLLAWKNGEVIINENRADHDNGDGDNSSTLAVPIKMRGNILGVLTLRFDSEVIPQDIEIVADALAERLAFALDNARLVQEAQLRATQEQLTGQVTSRIRETLDIDTILKTASQEIRNALDLPEVVIRLGTPSKARQDSRGNSNDIPHNSSEEDLG